jgi:hypothetical protein
MSVFLSIILLLAPIKVEKARFTITQDGKRIGTEEFTVTQGAQGYLVEGRTNIGDLSIASRMELNEKLVPTFYEYSSREGTIQVKVTNPISELHSIVGGETSSADFRFPDGGVILDNNFFHHYLIMLYRAHAGQTSFSVFVPQDMRIGSASVRRTNAGVYEVEAGDVKLQATIDADGRLLRLVVPDAKVTVER